jgi:restriction system protein
MLKLNRFVNFKVFFQCKRFKGAVSSEDVQKFKGALDGKIKAGDKGLIITTGYYTNNAQQEAYKEGGFPVELIDGEKLVEMFENLQLGLIPKTVYEIDYEFFKEFEKD